VSLAPGPCGEARVGTEYPGARDEIAIVSRGARFAGRAIGPTENRSRMFAVTSSRLVFPACDRDANPRAHAVLTDAYLGHAGRIPRVHRAARAGFWHAAAGRVFMLRNGSVLGGRLYRWKHISD